MKMENTHMKTLVVGASTNPDRYAYKAIIKLRAYDYSVLAFGLKKGTVGDVEILTELPTQTAIDTITLYVGPDRQAELIQPLLDLKPRRIIFNPGTENPTFIKQAEQAGVIAEIACTLVLLSLNEY